MRTDDQIRKGLEALEAAFPPSSLERLEFYKVMDQVGLETAEPAVLAGMPDLDDDVCRTGVLVEQRELLRLCLVRLVSFVIAWLRRDAQVCGGAAALIDQIYLERVRQRSLFLSRRITFDCADPEVSGKRKFRVMFEEAGETAQAVDKIEQLDNIWTRHHLATELVQLAAIATAWLEALAAREAGKQERAAAPRARHIDHLDRINDELAAGL
jgi:hypothetical protein